MCLKGATLCFETYTHLWTYQIFCHVVLTCLVQNLFSNFHVFRFLLQLSPFRCLFDVGMVLVIDNLLSLDRSIHSEVIDSHLDNWATDLQTYTQESLIWWRMGEEGLWSGINLSHKEVLQSNWLPVLHIPTGSRGIRALDNLTGKLDCLTLLPAESCCQS